MSNTCSKWTAKRTAKLRVPVSNFSRTVFLDHRNSRVSTFAPHPHRHRSDLGPFEITDPACRVYSPQTWNPRFSAITILSCNEFRDVGVQTMLEVRARGTSIEWRYERGDPNCLKQETCMHTVRAAAVSSPEAGG